MRHNIEKLKFFDWFFHTFRRYFNIDKIKLHKILKNFHNPEEIEYWCQATHLNWSVRSIGGVGGGCFWSDLASQSRSTHTGNPFRFVLSGLWSTSSTGRFARLNVYIKNWQQQNSGHPTRRRRRMRMARRQGNDFSCSFKMPRATAKSRTDNFVWYHSTARWERNWTSNKMLPVMQLNFFPLSNSAEYKAFFTHLTELALFSSSTIIFTFFTWETTRRRRCLLGMKKENQGCCLLDSVKSEQINTLPNPLSSAERKRKFSSVQCPRA